jgi:predicted DNA-binding transcriptional regulator YafY
MNKYNDNSPKNRLLGILKALLERPSHYTKNMFALKYNVSKDTISNDFDELRDAGFELSYDEKYRYAIVPSKLQGNLEELLFFTESDKNTLLEALKNTNAGYSKQKRIEEKLNTIYDVSKLGSSMFTNTFLKKVDLLEQANKEKRMVRLINYRSTNSSEVTDKLIEPFLVSVKEDILHAFSMERKDIRHFRISRIERIELTTDFWQNEEKHKILATDPFRIANNKQVQVHIKLAVGGYNELVERFPLTQAYLQPSANKANEYDFECKVNEAFLGLTNFILGYHGHIVEIIEPDNLREHIREHIKKINF